MAKDKSTLFIFATAGIASFGFIIFVIAFALPYWINFNEDLSVSDNTGSHVVNFRYTYGFWRQCNKVTSATAGNADSCRIMDSHTDSELVTIALLVLTMMLYISTLVNCVLYLSKFKKEPFSLYISLVSVIVAGILSVASLINFGTADHSLTVINDIKLDFTVSNLSASFWLTVVGCVDAVVTAVFISLAIRANRNELPREDRKPMLVSNTSEEKESFKNESIREQAEIDYSNSYIDESDGSDESDESEPAEWESEYSSDSDDSETDSKFQKLKYIKARAEDVASEGGAETFNPWKTTHMKPFRKSHSVPFLTPVEQTEAIDIIEEARRVKYENIFFGENSCLNVENNAPPPSTLISDLYTAPKKENGNLNISRAKTEIIVTKTKEELTPREGKVKEETSNIVLKKPYQSTKFLKRPALHRPKKRLVSKEGSSEKNRVGEAYSKNKNEIPVFPRRRHALPAPWSKPKPRHRGTQASKKSALSAQAVYINQI
ncbi:hypothetical protein ACF0H5_006381 [Mactra antiquata]